MIDLPSNNLDNTFVPGATPPVLSGSLDHLRGNVQATTPVRGRLDLMRLRNTAPANPMDSPHALRDAEMDPKTKQKKILAVAMALVMFILAPKKKKKKKKKKSPSEEPVEELVEESVVPTSTQVEELIEEPRIEQSLAEYQVLGDTEKQSIFRRAIAQKESGAWKKNPKQRLALTNTHAIVPGRGTKGKFLEKLGITVSILGKSTDAFPSGVPNTFEAFSEQACKALQPNISDPNREWNAAAILSCCACGKYQITPFFFFHKLGADWAPKGGVIPMEKLFLFLKNEGNVQERLVDIIIGDLAKKHNWNIAVMAAEYYSGPRAAKQMLANANDPRIAQSKAYGYGSTNSYSKNVLKFFEILKAEGADLG